MSIALIDAILFAMRGSILAARFSGRLAELDAVCACAIQTKKMHPAAL